MNSEHSTNISSLRVHGEVAMERLLSLIGTAEGNYCLHLIAKPPMDRRDGREQHSVNTEVDEQANEEDCNNSFPTKS